ncbi:aminotransferase class IV [Pseudopedobacter saltans DSM 12145]|uniref:branched-chain-amino-acid transaminase n=1 Tax=Pseudopedobacter saltans (strain ATCC 51119 / DSM 12145 / JCM 21818 / CCUG 39354 / LMG 10337 / NBRC 100064 / NCIMB 13643) TaxID=762903 RepID=F0SB33_PSESL|nr:aminotransferase class IV [Pseudopedobacter saltans]ADY52668.1 aminotransferase class IV [Pseudopedobacter saltans DSM 12145]
MSKRFINFNGEILQEEEKVLSLANRGFKYGDGLFETMRMSRGKLNFPEEHAERLQKGMKTLKIEGYSYLDAYFLKEVTEDLAKRNKISQNARFRLTVFRDSDGLYTPTDNKNGYSLEVSPLESAYYNINSKGLIMDVYDDILKPINKLSNLKTCSALPFVMAGLYKQQHRLDDVFILNQNGFLCEALSSNVFLVYKGQIYTPALSEGCVAGVMRQVVINLAAEHQLDIIEAQINPEILNEVEEVFVTNAINGIQWVMGFNRKRYFNEVSKMLLERLNSFNKV